MSPESKTAAADTSEGQQSPPPGRGPGLSQANSAPSPHPGRAPTSGQYLLPGGSIFSESLLCFSCWQSCRVQSETRVSVPQGLAALLHLPLAWTLLQHVEASAG